MSKLVTAETCYLMNDENGYLQRNAAQVEVPTYLWAHFVTRTLHGKSYPQPAGDATSNVITAFVNHGRWVGRCPNCGSAQVLSETNRKFYCAGCFNAHVGNQTVPVKWPTSNFQSNLENLLVLRPMINQNWTTETLKQIQAENVANGLEAS